MSPCRLALQFISDYPEEGPRLAMEFETRWFVYDMIRWPGRYMRLPDCGDVQMGALFAEALGAGKGCDADDVEL